MAKPGPRLPKAAAEGPDPLVDAGGGGTEEPPPPALGRTEGVPTCGWIAFALCLLGNGICRGHEMRGLQWLCTELARGEKKAKTKQTMGYWGLAQRWRSHGCDPREEDAAQTQPAASEAFGPAEPLVLELCCCFFRDRLCLVPAGEGSPAAPSLPCALALPGPKGLRSRQ